MELEFRSFDKAILQVTRGGGDTAEQSGPANLSITKQGQFELRLRDDLFLTAEGFDADVLKKAHRAARLSRGLPVGISEFRDVHVYVPTGFIFDRGNACYWKGWLLNLSGQALTGKLQREFGVPGDAKRMALSDQDLRGCPTMEMPFSSPRQATGFMAIGCSTICRASAECRTNCFGITWS